MNGGIVMKLLPPQLAGVSRDVSESMQVVSWTAVDCGPQ